MSNNAVFEKSLAKGMKFEDKVLDHLKKFTSIIVPTHDFKTGSYTGPKLYASGTAYTLPDFYCPNFNITGALIEAKLKKKSLSLPGQGTDQFVCIDESKLLDYRECCKHLRTELHFVVGLESTKKAYLIPDHDFLQHIWNNQYSKGPSACIPINQKYHWFDF